MNARQKAKLYKKKLDKLYAEYVNAVMAAVEAYDKAQDMVEDILLKQTTCSYKMTFSKPTEVSDSVARDMLVQLIAKDEFKQAVAFEGHTDPDTGEYILEAYLTVVMPEFDDEEEA